MTVENTSVRSGPYTTNGVTTVFPFSFRAISTDDLRVVLLGSDGVETPISSSLYDVTLTDEGGSVAFSTALPAGDPLYIELDPSFDQSISFENEGAFLPEVLTEGLDRAAIRDLYMNDRVNRSISLPVGDAPFIIPVPAGRLGMYLGFDPITGEAGVFQGSGSATDGSMVAVNLGVAGAVQRSVRDKLKDIVCPKDFGAVGDGVTDDGDALNAMFAYVRSLITANSFTAICVDGANAKYLTTKSINVTGLNAWSLTVRDLFVIGQCTGKAVFDLIATRGYSFENVSVWGDKTNRPTCAFQAQRGTPGGFCDDASFKECNVDGYFTVACVHDYGQETTLWSHCLLFNRDYTARVAIHEGYNANPMVSDYATLMAGGTSFTNKQFLNCDYRYLPADENIASITAVTIGPNAVVTAPGHTFQVGEKIAFAFVANMGNLSFVVATVTAITATTFTTNIDTTGYGAFGGSGSAIRCALKPPVYIARCEGFAMHDCYAVSYGQVAIEVGFPDPGFPRVEHLSFTKLLCEGAAQKASIGFTPSAACSVQGFELTTYNSHCFSSLIANLAPSFTVSFFGFKVQNVNPGFTIPLSDNLAQMAAYGADVVFGSLALVSAATWASFNGQVVDISTGKNTQYVADGIFLNANRVKLTGGVGSGAATPTLGSNKPGTTGSPATWMDIVIDGTTYCIPVWAKT